VSTNVKKIIAGMSGQAIGGGNILVNIDPGIASFQEPFADVKWQCGGYKLIMESGRGWLAQGWGIQMRPDQGAGNYEVGWNSGNQAECKFAARIDVDSFQIRVKTKARKISSKIASSKDLAMRCAPGYVYRVGDVPMINAGKVYWPGWGKVQGAGGGQGVKNCQMCADMCTQRALCKSYECSPTENKCNLNTGRFPWSKSKTYKDYNFCTRGPVFSVPQEESYNGRQCRHSKEGKNLPQGNWPYTIEAWVKPNKIGGTRSMGIIGWGKYLANGNAVTNGVNTLRIINKQALYNYWGAGGLASYNNLGCHLDDGKYHHVAVTWDGRQRIMFVDNKQVKSDIPSTPLSASNQNFCVGKTGKTSVTPASYYQGKMKGVKVWDIALTAKQLKKGFAERVACEKLGHGSFKSCTLGKKGDCVGRARLGFGKRWTAWKNVKGKFSCTNGFFGKDPSPGQAKECVCETGIKAL